MFTVNVTNNYYTELSINGSTSVPAGGGTGTTGSVQGTQYIGVPYMGDILVLDLGVDTIPGYELNGSYGILLRYKAIELYYRYDNDGTIDLTVDQYGDVNVTSVQGNALIISLNDMTYEGE